MTEHKTTAIREPFGKMRLFAEIAEETGLSRRQVAAVFESLARLMRRHLKKRSAGEFTLPGVAKFQVRVKKATRARKMVSNLTGEEIVVAAKPQHRVVSIRPLKALKDMAGSS
ncbi:MAG: HU family DNA-binding protein [Acidobacteriota bacterium]